MWDFFEQPWTLLGAAVIVLFVVLTVRSVLPEKRRWWQWLLPLAVAAAALGLDFLVATDLERIHTTLRSVLHAVEAEDCRAVASWIAPDYRDSRHRTKAQLMVHCREELDGPTVEQLKNLNDVVEISSPQATATVALFMRFNKDSRIAKQYKHIFLLKVRLHFKKQPDKRWLIDKAEILEIDKQPVSWRSV